MAHERQLIREAVIAQLKAVEEITNRVGVGASAKVFPHRQGPARDLSDVPCICVYLNDELNSEEDSTNLRKRLTATLYIEAWATARANIEVLENVLDDFAYDIETAMDNDSWFAATVKKSKYEGTQVEFDPSGSRPLGVVQLRYNVEYEVTMRNPPAVTDFITAAAEFRQGATEFSEALAYPATPFTHWKFNNDWVDEANGRDLVAPLDAGVFESVDGRRGKAWKFIPPAETEDPPYTTAVDLDKFVFTDTDELENFLGAAHTYLLWMRIDSFQLGAGSTERFLVWWATDASGGGRLAGGLKLKRVGTNVYFCVQTQTQATSSEIYSSELLLDAIPLFPYLDEWVQVAVTVEPNGQVDPDHTNVRGASVALWFNSVKALEQGYVPDGPGPFISDFNFHGITAAVVSVAAGFDYAASVWSGVPRATFDDVALYDRKLTDEEIKNSFLAGATDFVTLQTEEV